MAKNALLLLTRSWAAAYPGVCFNLFSPPSLEKAEVLPKQAHIVAPELVAERIFRIISPPQFRVSLPLYRPAGGAKK